MVAGSQKTNRTNPQAKERMNIWEFSVDPTQEQHTKAK
jgi:hypothetical protein